MAEAAKAKDWSCTQCTFLNDKNEDFCRICWCPKKNNKSEQSSVASQEHSQLILVSDKRSMDSNAPLPPPIHNGSADQSGFDMQRNQTTMAYHFNEYQKVFGQLQYSNGAKPENNGAYHFQQYQMRYEMIKCAGRHIR